MINTQKFPIFHNIAATTDNNFGDTPWASSSREYKKASQAIFDNVKLNVIHEFPTNI